MHIVSYRGPGMAGGVSAALARAWDTNLGSGALWWHLHEHELNVASGPDTPADNVAHVPAEVIEGHYRFCNEFLWPVMHDLPEYARFVPQDYYYYQTFNHTLGWCILRAHADEQHADFFVQDYQMALLPQFMRANAGFRSVVFWHIPWPKHVREDHVPYITAIARGLLSAHAVGFHTQEYAENFLRFVNENCAEYACDNDGLVAYQKDTLQGAFATGSEGMSRIRVGKQSVESYRHATKLIVAPLGIDYEHWSTLAARQDNTVWHPALVRTPFVLSVDRADYTKGVSNRIRAIDSFLEQHPEWIGRIVFAQVCGKTRAGLSPFENYWNESRCLYNELTARWATDAWQPLLWIEKSFSSAELALAYRTAAAMLVNPVRDGLNLTAKEYVACQGSRPGVLVLSEGAGAWQELGSHCVEVCPADATQMGDAIHRSLTMDSHERAWRMAILKELVRGNTLSNWWHTFDTLLEGRTKPAPAANLGYLRETS